MTVTSPTRHAALVLVFLVGQEGVIDSIEGLHGVDRRTRRAGTEVRILSGSPSGDACEKHLEALWERSSDVIDDLASRRSSVSYCALQIVQYIASDDSIGPGIPVSEEWVSALASLGGCLDIDQYVLEDKSAG